MIFQSPILVQTVRGPENPENDDSTVDENDETNILVSSWLQKKQGLRQKNTPILLLNVELIEILTKICTILCASKIVALDLFIYTVIFGECFPGFGYLLSQESGVC